MATVENDCIVHNRKYLSKFHANINQLRQTNQFNPLILQQLPKRCCSCNGQKGESIFTIDHLREVCQKIQPPQKQQLSSTNPVKSIPYHYVTLEYPSTLTYIERTYKIGRFVGRNGRHLRLLERTLNIHIYIYNHKSSKRLHKIFDGLNLQNQSDKIQVLFTTKNNNNNIESIKQTIRDKWNKTFIFVKPRERRSGPYSYGPMIPPSTELSGDTRWRPKKYKRIGKFQQKQESIEKQNIKKESIDKSSSTSKQKTHPRSRKR